jgi:hypothetical protein
MSNSDECPVCGTTTKEQIDTIDWGGPICEHYVTCPNGCYSYEYAYGCTSIYVGDLRFGWSYSDDKQVVKAETDAMDAAIEAARENQTRRSQEPR